MDDPRCSEGPAARLHCLQMAARSWQMAIHAAREGREDSLEGDVRCMILTGAAGVVITRDSYAWMDKFLRQ